MNSVLTNENLSIAMQPLGSSGEPLLIIDDFLKDPESLVASANASPGWSDVPAGGYPGRRAGLPKDYAHQTLRRLDPIIRSRIFKGPYKLGKFECSFSLVTRAAHELEGVQKLPHIDIADDNRVAILHYLCGKEFGGTAFFRQNSTGLEQVRHCDRETYLSARRHDLAELSGDDGFPDDQTPGYTRISHVEARFNRVVIYRSFTLHSGIIRSREGLPQTPSEGRLTANFFVDYESDDASR